jgi:uncharacterized membrane protein HdeD (DUF308 family)
MTDAHWRLLIVQGGGLIVFGIITAVLENATSLTVPAVVGWVLLISGLFRLASGLGADIASGHWSSMLLSALVIPLGAALVFYFRAGEVELKMALALYLILHAAASGILAASLQRYTRRNFVIFCGAFFDFVLAALLLTEWPNRALTEACAFLAFNLTYSGLALVLVGLDLHNRMQRA